MQPGEERSPRKAGSGNRLGGNVPTQHSLLDLWNLVGAATRDARLSRGDLAVLHSIASRLGEDGTAWPGFGRLASDTKLHRSTVERSIDRLEGCGYLLRESGGIGRSNRYWLTSRVDATGTSSGNATTPSSADATGTSSADATGCAATSSVDATGVVAPTRLGVVAPTRPELYPLNQSTELVQEDISPEPVQPPADRFSEFWSIYPRREAKASAVKSWRKHKLDREAERIIEDVRKRIADPGQWNDPKFTPLPASYLNGRRWEDEWQPQRKQHAGQLERDARPDDEIHESNEAELARFGMGEAA